MWGLSDDSPIHVIQVAAFVHGDFSVEEMILDILERDESRKRHLLWTVMPFVGGHKNPCFSATFVYPPNLNYARYRVRRAFDAYHASSEAEYRGDPNLNCQQRES
jgi:hypothetical protein